MSQDNKHVIILGAGASASSGYPVANKLRLLMASEAMAKKELASFNEISDEQVKLAVEPMFRGDLAEAIRLFRNGAYATVDEFSKVAGFRFHKEVQSLKRAVAFALALRNPEDQFEGSDYYPFIQKLFHRGLFPLRPDISILTFNYDPYLCFLLKRAADERCRAAGRNDIGTCQFCLASGFDSRTVGALESSDELCLLHLHGMIAWPDVPASAPAPSFHDLFDRKAYERLQKFHGAVPPIAFPWEVIDDDGQFRPKGDFTLSRDCDSHSGYTGPIDLYGLFTAIWNRAQKEITMATQISFVGLSLHYFMNPAFKFLFRNKTNDARIVIVNKDIEKFKTEDAVLKSPQSPVFKLRQLLKSVWNQKSRASHTNVVPGVETRLTFEEFIQFDIS
jgi:hypothetical protein